MIVELKKEAYDAYPLLYRYITNEYYDITMENHFGWKQTLTRRKFDAPVEKTFEGKLFEPYFDHPSAYGFFIENMLVGVIGLDHETWNNRIRISDLLVLDEHRGKGIGHQLMERAKTYAKERKARAIVLETQSCNTPAIDFYIREGFTLVGFDSMCYSNEDVAKKEIRLEFGYAIKEEENR